MTGAAIILGVMLHAEWAKELAAEKEKYPHLGALFRVVFLGCAGYGIEMATEHAVNGARDLIVAVFSSAWAVLQ